jgi:hypothetical protein
LLTKLTRVDKLDIIALRIHPVQYRFFVKFHELEIVWVWWSLAATVLKRMESRPGRFPTDLSVFLPNRSHLIV